MTNKKVNIEELEKQCLEAEKTFKTLNEQLTQAKKEEEKIKQSKLKEEKEIRKKEIEQAEEHYRSLVKAYIKDYGSYSTSRTYSTTDDYDFPFLFGSKPWRMIF